MAIYKYKSMHGVHWTPPYLRIKTTMLLLLYNIGNYLDLLCVYLGIDLPGNFIY